ncbi:hypothetical protein SLV14_003633 [Streptomyces sp. Je 1-4]|uniref:hypothetical protein n=1 Tax=Streptomyces TaxID=1883 RepID=UPI0021D9A37E|nr:MULTISPECIES: hypothetical protein [unclassified Streptomyces]UYB40953.1 hypothetical protein SLV14_003633 [Streptomyces sp. Je 1-4]UZQ37114.1 hypothetical protein SLV14N_003633 [Streptomyces sp. Je 1-4] [Streptomyces sp. Je 1-4 4N24]UZQ44531.1 hypothetical protein SLV14NA_003633 [Streptomyces sp. Je 1-4] [Streptomyces sp. Je 1-4 4N24_ara]
MEPEEPDEDEFVDENDDGEPFLDTCDQCGGLLQLGLYEGDDPLLTVLPDSSAIYQDNPKRDGTVMVMVCSAECLQKIEEKFRQRPFVHEELWAGKIVRAIMEHPQGLSPRELDRETGLKPSQILAGLAWLEERRRGSKRSGGPGGSAAG